MIKRILAFLLLGLLFVAMILKVNGVNHVELGEPFYAFMKTITVSMAEWSDIKIPDIPDIPLLESYGNMWIDVLNFLIRVVNAFVVVLNIIIGLLNYIMEFLKFIVAIIKQLKILIDELISQGEGSNIVLSYN